MENIVQSIRIVNLDFYMTTPSPGLDPLYSEFRGATIAQVPVLRVFGATNTGKKMCLHVHGAFPYFYIPYDGAGDVNSLMYQIATTIDKVVNISFGQTSSNAQHVYKIILVSGKPFYGYHVKNHQFLKIYLYNPILIRKVSNLLESEAISGKFYQPHESHIPFTLQFMIDYNLHGMSLLYFNEIKYRNEVKNDLTSILKTSYCELEGDILAENILNRLQLENQKSIANPGIMAIWEDEKQRRRNKGEISQIGTCLTLSPMDLPQTKTHEFFKKILNEKLTIFSKDKDIDENTSVYPAETPEDETVLNASTLDMTTFGDFNDSLSTTYTSPADQTINEDAQKLMDALQNLYEDIKAEDDSILSQNPKLEEDEEDQLDMSLPLAAFDTPMKMLQDTNEEQDSDDSLDKTLVPQLDGLHDDSSDDDKNRTIKKKSKKYHALPISVQSTKKPNNTKDTEGYENIKRKLHFTENILDKTVVSETNECEYKKFKKNTLKDSLKMDDTDLFVENTPPLLTKSEIYDKETSNLAMAGSSNKLSQNSTENQESSGSSSSLITPYQKEGDEGDIENSYNSLKSSYSLFESEIKPPTRLEVMASLNNLQIPSHKYTVPFYSNPEDVTGSVEIGYNILRVDSKSVLHTQDFKGTFKGIDDIRKTLLDNLKWTQTNLNNVKLQYCKSGYTVITPLQKPPKRSEILKPLDVVTETTHQKPLKKKVYIQSSQTNFDDDESDMSLTLSQSQSVEDPKSQTLKKSTENSCNITCATMDNTYGFKSSSNNYQNVKPAMAHQYLTILVMELHIRTRDDYKPNPELDEIRAIFYAVSNDVPDGFAKPQKTKGIIAVNTLRQNDNHVPILNGTGTDCYITYVNTEEELFHNFLIILRKWDPDILAGYEIELLSWGYFIDRAARLNINLMPLLARIKDSYQKSSDKELRITGRILLDIWRLFRHEIALQSYTFENIVYHILHERVPFYVFKELSFWWDHRTNIYRHRTVDYYLYRVETVIRLLAQLDLIGRTSELARLFGIQFFEVLSRGSQFRVESMMLRLAKPANYIPVSPSVQQRAKMRSPEFLPLILEPESKLYVDPVIVLDFQSLYPSMIIAYNYCFSTCIGRVEHLGKNSTFEFGATQLRIPRRLVKKLLEKDCLNFSPCGVGFVKPQIRDGILPRMLREIIETRLMVKKSMKENKEDRTLQKVLHNRQLGLKLIANVTYGYTSANFSGRMPAVEVGDSVLSKARETLQRAIEMVENTKRWGAKVVYGDTDSLFVMIKGQSREKTFEIGKDIAETITKSNPNPVKLKLEKVYHPCILQTKKRYVGYMYESEDQKEPIYDAKGIETVRRDGCPAVSKILEKSLRLLFETRDVSLIKKYVLRQFSKIVSGRISLQELTFAKQYRGAAGYRPGACVPALELTRKWTAIDKRNEPRSGERVPYIIANGPPGLPLIKLVRSPRDFLADSSLRPNSLYYITKVIIPPLNRCFNLIGVDINLWFNQMPRKQFQYLPTSSPTKKFTISQYFATTSCVSCTRQTKDGVCDVCKDHPQSTALIMLEKVKQWEKVHSDIQLICHNCTGEFQENNCISLDCPVLYRLSQANKDLQQVTYVRQLLEKYL